MLNPFVCNRSCIDLRPCLCPDWLLVRMLVREGIVHGLMLGSDQAVVDVAS